MSASQNKIPVADATQFITHLETTREAVNIQSQKVIAEFLENIDNIDAEALGMIVELMRLDLEIEQTDNKMTEEIIKNMEDVNIQTAPKCSVCGSNNSSVYQNRFNNKWFCGVGECDPFWNDENCVAHPDYYCDGGCGLVVDESKRKCGDC